MNQYLLTNAYIYLMKLFKALVLWIAVGVFVLSSCKRKGITENDYPIYIYKESIANGRSNFELHTKKTIWVSASLDVKQQLQIIADSIADIAFNGLQIKITEIEFTTDTAAIAEINLIENSLFTTPGSVAPYQSWYDFFQGSAGGSFTYHTLQANFLHRKINDTSVVALRFLYNGSDEVTFDHVPLFDSLIK
jgi:hypothetical protein